MQICNAPSSLLFLSTFISLFLTPSIFSSAFQLSDHQHPRHSNASDEEALLAFLSAITYDPWQSLAATWKRNVSFCEWRGVICSRRRQRVVSLNVSSMELQGTISPLLGNLSFLRILDLGNNTFHGHIPYQLGNLFRLKKLYLYLNQLQGSVPPNLGRCRRLSILSLTYNNLSGSIPPELCVFPKLKTLALGVNSLTGRIPACLGNISSLNAIDLSRNNFHGSIPLELGMLRQINYISMGLNNLRGQIPSFFSNFTNLGLLDITLNQLTGHIPAELCSKNTRLTALYLGRNQLSGTIPASLFNCTNLQLVDINDNQLCGMVPMELGKLTQLQILDLGANQLVSGSSTSIPILTVLTNCSNLNFIDLSSNRLTGRLPFSIGRLSREIYSLNLSENALYGEIPPHIGNLSGLTYLDLQANSFSGAIPVTLKKIQKLERLFMGNNHLRGNIPMEIGQFKSLGLLDIHYNNLSGRIPNSIASLYELRYLYLNMNQLSGKIPANLGKCVNLLLLDLSYNQLSGHIPPEVAGLANLAFYFNISNNLLDRPLPLELSKMTMLQAIDVSANQLTGYIPSGLGSCKELEYLNLSYNVLEGMIPVSLGELQSLQNMDFSSNNLSGILCTLNHKRNISIEVGASLNIGHQRISYGELSTATNGFSDANLLGVGSFGKVYKGVLNNGTMVAIKLLDLENEGAHKSFKKECKVLGRVRHRNLIRIITSYSDLHVKALIFPFIPNGSLEKWLYPDAEVESGLTLLQRLNIAIDIAQGVVYLHHHCFMQVIHCDLKPNNVLLDEDMTTYVIDFGIATICFANYEDSTLTSTLALKGSAGYIPPEYGLGGHVTTKGDVYSYGIILLEMLTGKKPTNNIFVEGMNLQKWVGNNFPNQLREVVDKSLLRRTSTSTQVDKDLNCLSQSISMGFLCTKDSPEERPTMVDIVCTLQSIRDTFQGIVGIPESHSNFTYLLGDASTYHNITSEDQISSTF
eukprot:PITA_30460